MHRHIIIAAGACLLFATESDATEIDNTDFCRELLAFEEQTNRTLPRKTDSITTLIQIRVNCELKIATYVFQIDANDSDLAPGWKERKQRQHDQLHCNQDGLASTLGWTARTTLYSREYNLLAEYFTRPDDC